MDKKFLQVLAGRERYFRVLTLLFLWGLLCPVVVWGEEEIDWSEKLQDGGVTIEDGGTYCFKGFFSSRPLQNIGVDNVNALIAVNTENDEEVTIVLEGLSIYLSGEGHCPLSVRQAKGKVTILLRGDNTLSTSHMGGGSPALWAPEEGGTLVIKDDENVDGVGKLIARGPYTFPGIGVRPGQRGDITIESGIIESSADFTADGIGAENGKIMITGGTVVAKEGKNGFGISGTLSTGDSGNAFIVASSIYSNQDYNRWSGVIIIGNAGKVYGNPTLKTNATIPEDKTLTVEDGKTLTIGEGVTLTIEGKLQNNGKIVNNGTINGEISGNPVFTELTEGMIDVSDITYTGEKIDPEVKVANKDGFFYQKETDYTITCSDGVNAGDEVTVTIEPISSSNVLGGTAVAVALAIEQAGNDWTAKLSIDDWTYGEEASKPTAKAVFGDVTFTYSNDESGTYNNEVPSNAGTWYVKATVEETDNYKGLEATKEFEITQAKNEWTEPLSTTGWTYGGEAYLTAKAKFGTPIFTYSDGQDGQYTSDVPTNAGTWYVKATVEENKNYEGLTSTPVKFTISPAKAGLSFAKTEKSLEQGETYTNTLTTKPEGLPVTYSSNDASVATVDANGLVTAKKVGTATITATVADGQNYAGTATYTITVEKKEEVTPPPYYPSYYDLAFNANDSVSFSARSVTVREGGSFRFTAQAAEGYDPVTLAVEYRRGRWGSWQTLTPETDGEYHIYNVWNDIYVRASVDRKEEDPTANLPVDDAATRIRAVGNRIGIRLPYPSSLCIVGLDGRVIRQADLPAGDSWIDGLPSASSCWQMARGQR